MSMKKAITGFFAKIRTAFLVFSIKVQGTHIDKDKNYIWQFGISSPQQVQAFAQLLAKLRPEKGDIITDPSLKLIAADKIHTCFSTSNWKKKDDLLKAIDKALGKGQNINSLAAIYIDYTGIQIVEYSPSVDLNKVCAQNDKRKY